VVVGRFQLPRVTRLGSSLALDSSTELQQLAGSTSYRRWEEEECEAVLPYRAPAATKLTSQSYLGPGRGHPQFQFTIYQILQRRPEF